MRLRPVAFLDRTGDWSGYSGRAVEAMFVVADGAPDRILDANSALFELWVGMADEIAATGIEPTDDDVDDLRFEPGALREEIESRG